MSQCSSARNDVYTAIAPHQMLGLIVLVVY